MIEDRLGLWTSVQAEALLFADRLDLRAIAPGQAVSALPLAIAAGREGLAVLFRYGAIVLFNVGDDESARFLGEIVAGAGERHGRPARESAEIRIDPGATEGVASDGVIHLKAATADRFLVIADVLAKSVALADYEDRLAQSFDRVEPVALALKQPRSWRPASVSPLLSQIGDVLLTQHRMVGRVEVTEKPDLLWDKPDLERLYLRLEDEYELAERDRALGRKLDLISQTASTSLGLLQEQRGLRLEWAIVILIMIEIVISLYELAIGSGH